MIRLSLGSAIIHGSLLLTSLGAVAAGGGTVDEDTAPLEGVAADSEAVVADPVPSTSEPDVETASLIAGAAGAELRTESDETGCEAAGAAETEGLGLCLQTAASVVARRARRRPTVIARTMSYSECGERVSKNERWNKRRSKSISCDRGKDMVLMVSGELSSFLSDWLTLLISSDVRACWSTVSRRFACISLVSCFLVCLELSHAPYGSRLGRRLSLI